MSIRIWTAEHTGCFRLLYRRWVRIFPGKSALFCWFPNSSHWLQNAN